MSLKFRVQKEKGRSSICRGEERGGGRKGSARSKSLPWNTLRYPGKKAKTEDKTRREKGLGLLRGIETTSSIRGEKRVSATFLRKGRVVTQEENRQWLKKLKGEQRPVPKLENPNTFSDR